MPPPRLLQLGGGGGGGGLGALVSLPRPGTVTWPTWLMGGGGGGGSGGGGAEQPSDSADLPAVWASDNRTKAAILRTPSTGQKPGQFTNTNPQTV